MCCAAQVSDSGSVQCAPVAELRLARFAAKCYPKCWVILKVDLFGTELLFFTGEIVCAVLCKFGTRALYNVQ